MLGSVNGLFGFVRKNHVRSLFMFGGFAVSMQIALAALLSFPLGLSAPGQSVFSDPVVYFQNWGLTVFGISLTLFGLSYLFHILMIRLATGFEFVQPYENRRLERIVEDLAVTAGIPKPRIGIIPTPALNAFACGTRQSDAAIIVTQGLINELNDDELRAVIAHETAHIANGDVELMAVANASYAGIKLLNLLNPFKLEVLRKLGCFVIILGPILFLLIIIGGIINFTVSLSNTIAGVTRYFISSSREFIADAEAVRLTHNPAALISALHKIEGRSLIPHLDPMTDSMMIDGPADGEMAGHPPIQDRIAALMQYAGTMVHGAAEFRDTRGFARKINPTMISDARVKGMYRRRTAGNVIDRINRGSGKNVLGLEGTFGNIMLLLFVLPMLYWAWTDIVGNPLKPKEKPSGEWVKADMRQTPFFLVVDLNGDGKTKTLSLSRSKTFFDVGVDEHKEKVGWLHRSDGFVFLDKNANGVADGMAEMLSATEKEVAGSDRLITLDRLDSNRDGYVDERDRLFASLKIWQDKNSDAVSTPAEVKNLREVGIQRFLTQTDKKARYQRAVVASAAEYWMIGSYDIDPSSKNYGQSTDRRGYVGQVRFMADFSKVKTPAGQLVYFDALAAEAEPVPGLAEVGMLSAGADVDSVIKLSPIFLAVDLDGDGLETKRVGHSEAFLDVNKDGYREQIGAMAADDGLLFLDINQNGAFDGMNELLKTPEKVGKAKSKSVILDKLDSNQDGYVDRHDRQWRHIRIWRDRNGDGRGQKDEAYPLSDYGIVRFPTKSKASEENPEVYEIWSGARIVRKGLYDRDPKTKNGFRFKDPEKGGFAQVMFETDLSKVKDKKGEIKRFVYHMAPKKPRPYVRDQLTPSLPAMAPVVLGPQSHVETRAVQERKVAQASRQPGENTPAPTLRD